MALDRKELATVAILGVGGYILYQYWLNQGLSTTATIGDALQTIGENAMNTLGLASWKTVGQGPTYVPYLNQAEQQYGIPTDLLARIAYQESHFRQDIITGGPNSAGAIGLMQLEQQYYPNAGADPVADIQTAAQALVADYNTFGHWQLAVAAYNDGAANVKGILAGTHVMPDETRNYVDQVFADVPVQGSLVAVS